MIFKSSENPKETASTDTIGWKTCPQCGESYDILHTYCKNCHYFSSDWQGSSEKSNWRTRWRKRLLYLALVLFLLLFSGYLVWIARHYIPNPLLLLDKPISNIHSRPQMGEWTNFGHDPAHSRYVAKGKVVVGRIVWSINPGQYTSSTPAIKGKTLYLGGYFKVQAINTETGDSIWDITTTGPVKSSPAIAGNLVYFALLDGRVLALNRFTGKSVWEFKTGNYVFGSPTVMDGILYIGSGDFRIYALDAATGQLIWKYKANGTIPFSPVVKDGILYIASVDKTIYSLDRITGALRLRFRNYWSFKKSPVIGNGFVYFVSSKGHLDAFKFGVREFPGRYRMTQIWGQVWLWGFPVPFPPRQPGAVWRISPNNRWDKFVSSPAVTPESLYLGDTAGRFYSRDAVNGRSLWSFKVDEPISSPALVLGDTVYFGSRAGNLFALDRHTGTLIWKLPLRSPVKAGPVYGAGRIFIRTTDGWLHAIE